ncbi:hypothetical protein [Paenibacillus sp. 2TAB19]|uniref:hypothetical protein n=1 Tax=Paenibacillus sp. 2TAB19 TaxID=3233003 RepID=UPI003F9A0B6D
MSLQPDLILFDDWDEAGIEPAVKENRVFWLNSKFNYDDPITLDRLLDEIVTIMNAPAQ